MNATHKYTETHENTYQLRCCRMSKV